jgi:hypothetical protein
MQRFDMLQFIHKALRHAILSLNIESGRVDYVDTDETKRLDEAWMLLCQNLGHHAQHEDAIIFPLLDARAPGEAEELGREHEVIQRLEAGMTLLLDRVEEASDPDLRRLLGREFHRAMQHYTAVCLSHFDNEERHLMPRLWALYDDVALQGAFGRIMSTVGGAEREYTMEHMQQALDPTELEELRARLGG